MVHLFDIFHINRAKPWLIHTFLLAVGTWNYFLLFDESVFYRAISITDSHRAILFLLRISLAQASNILLIINIFAISLSLSMGQSLFSKVKLPVRMEKLFIMAVNNMGICSVSPRNIFRIDPLIIISGCSEFIIKEKTIYFFIIRLKASIFCFSCYFTILWIFFHWCSAY